mgnify:CR=1 FL=1
MCCLAEGIVLDADKNWACVSRPYDKFFNHGEPLADEIDWSSAQAFVKEDGTLMQLYWFNGEWLVGTTGSCCG